MSKLSIIIVNYNTVELLEKCLFNLQEMGLPKEVVVVDNGSNDGSAQRVKDNFPDVILVEAQNNGLAVGSNLGLSRATGDYLLYLGTDAFPTQEVLAGIVEYMEENPEVGICTAKLVLRDGSPDPDAHRGFPTPWAALTHFSKLNKLFPKSKTFNQYFLGYKNFDEPHEIDLCISHFMFVRRKVFEDIGTWDEDFFVYGEDVDFCYRAKSAGWKIMYLPQFEVLHYKGAGVGIRKETKDIKTAASTSEENKKRMRLETTKAMKTFYKKHYKDKYPKWLTGFVLFGIESLERLRRRGIGLG
jgi:GT2 family glycosyltransferase